MTAVFGAATFRLTTSVGGKGKVSSSPGGVSCPGRCSAAFRADSSVRLRAAASPGFRFAGWTGSCRGTRPCVVKLNREPHRPRDVPPEVGLGRRATKSGAAVGDESLLEEMRAAVRGDRQRAEKRRAAAHQPADLKREPHRRAERTETSAPGTSRLVPCELTRRRRST